MQTEKEMRESKEAWPKSEKELLVEIRRLTEREHEYGTCVYAMSLAAAATFNYVASKLGCTGFQASCADLDFVRRTRGIEGPFALFKLEDALYPQYDLPGELLKFIEGNRKWMAEQAKKKLAEGIDAHPNVIAHWKKPAAYKENE
jgi:hypothetical protein